MGTGNQFGLPQTSLDRAARFPTHRKMQTRGTTLDRSIAKIMMPSSNYLDTREVS